MKHVLSKLCLMMGVALASSAHAGDVKVLSAVVKDKTIDGAQIIWQRNGESSQKAQTSAEGIAGFPHTISDNDNTTMIISKAGYSTLVVKCPCDNLTYALSPVMQNVEGLRVVLTWGETPSDLDSHIIFPGNHIYFENKTGTDANLDVDDTTSFGPETITIERKHVGQRYVYAVHDYSNGVYDHKDSKELSFSQARVEVYVGQTMIRSYRVRTDVTATSWVIFGIDDNGTFHDINQYLNLDRDGLAKHMNSLIAAPSFEDHSLITPEIQAEAKRINTAGEAMYQQKRFEEAMYAFQDAINLYPSYGQAYSNLGVTYIKLDRIAEALWANRKAIELAQGVNKARVQASSYYNIGQIYEKSGSWLEALDNYRQAKSLRAHDAYDQGIDRMQQKLAH